MTTDPKTTIKNIVQTYIAANPITKDDGIASAFVLCAFEGGPEDFDYLFNDAGYDVIITFGEPSVSSSRDIQDIPTHYAERYPGTVTTIDKFNLVGTRICTAVKIQHKAGMAMRAAIEASAQSTSGTTPVYTVKILDERGANRRVGGLRVWETPYYIQYKDA